MDTFTAIDFETASGYRNSICQVGLVQVEEGIITNTLNVLVQPPDNYYWNRFTEIHGIAAKDTFNSPTFDQIWHQIAPYIENQNVVAHNGFGFDFRFMYEELHSYMREFKIVGDINQTKSLSGNGLFFFDFSLIYREKLSNLARTFFPNDVNNHKLDSSVVIGLKKDDI